MPAVNVPIALAFAGVFIVAWLLARAVASRALNVLRLDNDRTLQRASTLENEVKELRVELGAAKADVKHGESERDGLRSDLESTRARLKQLSIAYVKIQAQSKEKLQAADDKLRLLTNAEAMLAAEFENLANRIFKDKEQQFVATNRESISKLLKPVEAQLSEFKSRVEQVYDEETRDRASLRAEIVYDLQVDGTNDENERHRPDVIIRLPQKKAVVIDSKVKLAGFARWQAATSPDEQRQGLHEHIAAVREHIGELSTKGYQDVIGANSLDLVLMLIPIESAYTLALDHDPSLLMDAFQKKIMVVSPRTLVLFSESVTEIATRLAQAQAAFETSRRRLMRGTTEAIDGARVDGAAMHDAALNGSGAPESSHTLGHLEGVSLS